MSADANTPRTADELEAEMEAAFSAGAVGQTALLAWEVLARFPNNSAVARIYAKKLLRDPQLASITLEVFEDNAKKLRETGEIAELAELAALGLLRFPAQRRLSLLLLEAGQRLNRTEWTQPIIDSLGTPADDDIVLLNIVASHETTLGHYEQAAALFGKLRQLKPTDETILQNYSASLTGLERFDEAISLLENYLPQSDEPRDYLNRLIPLYRLAGRDVEGELNRLDTCQFASCDSPQNARVHANLRLFLGDLDGHVFGLERLLSYAWSAKTVLELSEARLSRNELESGLEGYALRFEAFPGIVWYQSDVQRYTGQNLEAEWLFVWAEQGIGDELMFAMFLEFLLPKVSNLVIALDHRLIPCFNERYSHWRFVDRHNLPKDLPAFDYACPIGDLMCLFLPALLEDGRSFRQPTIEPDASRAAMVADSLGQKTRPRIAVSWRGGVGLDRKIRSLELAELLEGLPDDADVEVISLQYDGDHEREVRVYGDSRVASSGLNNRDDLEGVFALIRCCDVVITVDNAVAHFAAALGVPTAVLLPAARVQFRWHSRILKRLFFPTAVIFVQSSPKKWRSPVIAAWQYALEICRGSTGPRAGVAHE